MQESKPLANGDQGSIAIVMMASTPAVPHQLEEPSRAKKRKMSSMAENWTDRQVKMLISMWKEPNVLEAINKPKPVYVLLANRLNDVWGNIDCPDRCIWDPHMVKDKIRNLRLRYRKLGQKCHIFCFLFTLVLIRVVTSQNLVPAKFDKNLNQNTESR